jgi:aryl-alcohol dehydrogenase-like predicted oxidoreductase
LEYRRISNTDLNISRIGFGCWAIGGHGYGHVDDEASIKAIRAALDLGINLFDTAGVYGFGHSEKTLQKALGKQAKDVVVATKFGIAWTEAGLTYRDCSPSQIIQSLDGSLKRLRLDTIPIFQLHWHDGVTPLDAIVETLDRCRSAGKVRYAGFCNMRLNEWGQRKRNFIASQLRYGLSDHRQRAELSELQQNGVAGLVYGVLSRGLLTGKYDANTRFGEGDTRGRDPDFTTGIHDNLQLVDKLKHLSSAYGKSLSQLAIRWALESPGVASALVGMKTKAQAVDNAGAAGWSLNHADRELLAGRTGVEPH